MMNRILGFASLGLAVVALGVALSNAREPAPPPAPAEPPSVTGSQDVEALQKRVKALEDTLVLLSSRVMVLERQPATPGAAAGTAPVALAQEVEQLKTEVRAMVAGEALNSQGGRDYLKDMMRSVQDEMRVAQRQERQEQWTQGQAQAQTERAERVRKFVSEAGLNYTQEQELTRRLQDEDTKRQALLEAVSSGSKSPRDIRQDMRALRTGTDEAMQKVLTPEQQLRYEELRREDRGPMRQGGWQPGGQGGRPAAP